MAEAQKTAQGAIDTSEKLLKGGTQGLTAGLKKAQEMMGGDGDDDGDDDKKDSKDKKGRGAIIGGIIGAAGGYAVGRGADKKDGRY